MTVLFMGTPSFAVPSLRALLKSGHRVPAVITRPDRPAGRGLEMHPPAVKVAAEEAGVEVHQPEKIRSAAFLDVVRSHRPDALVVVAFGRILPPSVLEVAPHGGINVHASLLPKYRGAAPIAWAIASGEEVTGVTTMKMAEKLDAGDILLQRSTSIGASETTLDLEARLAAMGASLLLETLRALESGSLAFLPQREVDATFAPVILKENARIDWTMPARAIACRVRAFIPWPVAFTAAKGKTIRVFSACPASKEPGVAAPGHLPGFVVSAGATSVRIACGEGSALDLLEVQPEGRRRMTAREASAGRYFEPGDLLG